MKSIVTYLCSDGTPHAFDAANRRTPICGADVFVIGFVDRTAAPSCEWCAFEVLDIVEGFR